MSIGNQHDVKNKTTPNKSSSLLQSFRRLNNEYNKLRVQILFEDPVDLKIAIVESLDSDKSVNLLKRIIDSEQPDEVRNAALDKFHLDTYNTIDSLKKGKDWKQLETLVLTGETEDIKSFSLDRLLTIIDSLDPIHDRKILETVAHDGLTDEIRKTAIDNLHHEESKRALHNIISCMQGTSLDVKKTAAERLKKT